MTCVLLLLRGMHGNLTNDLALGVSATPLAPRASPGQATHVPSHVQTCALQCVHIQNLHLILCASTKCVNKKRLVAPYGYGTTGGNLGDHHTRLIEPARHAKSPTSFQLPSRSHGFPRYNEGFGGLDCLVKAPLGERIRQHC